ncbi:hypothetical protein [Arcanobacterium buesumense]|uniref:hypothetical protein n=1 Tax=Arcanobacterium buesumense TaxID=2722751 RepID=UPI001B3ACEC6|nr:hypothetical protein [Arcanobacterium buesumense]
MLPRKTRKCLTGGEHRNVAPGQYPKDVWSLDFQCDSGPAWEDGQHMYYHR